MIRISQQWAILIDITNHCHLHCSNCTRLVDHRTKDTAFFMSPECFEQAVRAVKDFPKDCEPCVSRSHRGGRRIVGLIGGEPLLHPQFPDLVDIMVREIPEVYYRGLLTAKDWMRGSHPKWGAYRPQVERLLGPHPTHDGSGPSEKHACGWINWNMHTAEAPSRHQPVLVASRDAVPDEQARWDLIESCWHNLEWCSTVTPKGYFFCEIAGALDAILDGPGGLPMEPGVWKGDLWFETDATGVRRPKGKFAEQIERACPSCGACLPLPGRLDHESRDDLSVSHLIPLQAIKSPRVRDGAYALHTFDEAYDPERYRHGWDPKAYVTGQPMSGYGK